MKNPRIPPELLARARELRKNMTKAEALLWEELRQWRNMGFTVRRQHIVPPYILDFAETATKTAIEIDGFSHIDNEASDKERQSNLERDGWTFIRISDREVLLNRSALCSSLFDFLRAKQESNTHVIPSINSKASRDSAMLVPPLEGEGLGRGLDAD